MPGKALQPVRFTQKPHLLHPPQEARRVTLDAPAIEVMTDFSTTLPVVATPEETLVEAEERMIRRGVRSVLVLDPDGRIAGILTAADILGEQPLRYAQDHGLSPKEVRVGHLMTPVERMDALTLEQVARATVADIVATLQALGRQHTLVVENRNGEWAVRGIFSSTQIARQLGIEVPVLVKARTFAEIEAELK
ncbi:hypothetical protein JCM16106_15280 [Hydrogenophilus islandicus]